MHTPPLRNTVHSLIKATPSYRLLFSTMMFSNITPDKPSNFYQALRGPDQVNWIKVEFLHYDNKGDFGLFTATFTCDNLPSTTQVLLYFFIPNHQ